MKNFLFAVSVCSLFAFSACSDKESAISEQLAPTTDLSFITDDNEDGHTNLPAYDFREAVQEHVAAHSVNFDDVTKVTEVRPDGITETLYQIDEDIQVTADQLDELRVMDASLEKQYRTNNLVSDNNISVIGYTGNGFALTGKMRTALSWAVNNYNALNTNKTFTLRFAADTNADIVVYRNVDNDGAGGVAGFPSGGAPFKWVQIYNGMQNYDTNTNEHVITHEIGHCMGLRHTDWFSRQSCGQSGEGRNPDGAVRIPGTPSGFDANSVMLACFGSDEDGEFGFYDRVALETIY